MKNYLEHEIEVKYMDCCLESSKDWSWFLEELKASYELDDISSWEGYLKANSLLRVYSYFVRIVSINGVDIHSDNPILNDIISIAQLFKGLSSYEACKNSITTAFGSVLLLVVRIAMLINASNGTNYLFYGELLTRYNEYQLFNMNAIDDYSEEILSLSSSIGVEGFELARMCLEDNVHEVFHGMAEGFFDDYQGAILNADCFNYQNIKLPDYRTWQEAFLLDMLSVHISNGKLDPLMVFGGIQQPDISRWTRDVINKMKAFFADDTANFVLETIAYILYKDSPSNTTMLKHCVLYCQEVDQLEKWRKLAVSSYYVLSYLFADKKIYDIKSERAFRTLLDKIHESNDPLHLDKLNSDKFPLSKEQKSILIDYYENLYKTIDDVVDVHGLLDYFRNPNVVKRMTTDYFLRVKAKFFVYTEDKNNPQTPDVFYEYMLFLMEANSKGININKNVIKGTIIAVQQLWQEEYYKATIQSMQIYEYKQTFLSSHVDKYNELILKAPLLIAKNNNSLGENKIIEIMKYESANPLKYFIKSIEISQMYPLLKDEEHLNANDVDKLIIRLISKIVETKGYKFLNVLSEKKYLMAYYARVRLQANCIASFVGHIEKKLYKKVSQDTGYPLIKYNKKLTLAHITQLFPYLEQMIRKIGSLTGYVPFQLNEERFMKYKDPSTLLIEILTDIYKESSAFESAPDILMAFNYMYNVNSLNIRNECIHGRDYQDGDSLRYAFRLTLFVMNTLLNRIRIIEENIVSEENAIDSNAFSQSQRIQF